MLKFAFALAILVAEASGKTTEKWIKFKGTYNKVYSGSEESVRRFIWESNVKMIEAHNERYSCGETSFYLGENQFTDMTFKEFADKIIRVHHYWNDTAEFKSDLIETANQGGKNVTTENFASGAAGLGVLPDHVDWRSKGAITPPPNQGQCNAGYAFAAVGAVEALHFIALHSAVRLSAANIIDCSQMFGNQGCDGGTPLNAFLYIMDNTGIDTEASYPYTGRQGPCRFNNSEKGAMIGYPMVIPTGSEEILQWNVYQNGPVAVCINVNQNFQLYKGGIFDDPTCSSELPINHFHCVLVVGYGIENSVGYWLVRNSWGSQWGEAGYIRMAKNKNNQCAIASLASLPFVAIM